MDNTSIFIFFPIIFFLLIIVAKKNKQAPSINYYWSVFYAFSTALIYGFGDIVKDKLAYSNLYITGFDDVAKDIGWVVYSNIIKNILGDNVYLYFTITALLYCGSYLYFGKVIFGGKKAFTFIVLATGLLGFASYGCNTLRQGLALSSFLVAFALKKRNIQYLLFLISITLHISLVLLIGSCFITSKFDNTKKYISVWIICFILSALGFNLISYFSSLGGADYRFIEYSLGAESARDSIFSVGFRLDFILYSLIPLIYASYLKYKCKIIDVFYNRVLNLYICVNSIWLLIIRLPYTDRFAYLSWFLIPILLYYPYSKGLIYENKIWLFKSITITMLMIVIVLAFRP